MVFMVPAWLRMTANYLMFFKGVAQCQRFFRHTRPPAHAPGACESYILSANLLQVINYEFETLQASSTWH